MQVGWDIRASVGYRAKAFSKWHNSRLGSIRKGTSRGYQKLLEVSTTSMIDHTSESHVPRIVR